MGESQGQKKRNNGGNIETEIEKNVHVDKIAKKGNL